MLIRNKLTSALIFSVLLFTTVDFDCASSTDNTKIEHDVISLAAKISLPVVRGRLDHIGYDATHELAFIAALGNNSVEVVNINTSKVIHSIKGLNAPQGLAYLPSSNRLVIANEGRGKVDFFNAADFTLLTSIDLKDDADNVRYDASENLVYVGYGKGGIAMIDANTMKLTGDIKLDGHPESFQIDKKQNCIYINVPDADEIEVADIKTKSVIIKWKNARASSNFPMALDAENNRLFIGYRSPAVLDIISTQTGKGMYSASCSGDADDVFYDSTDSLVFVSTGKGFIDVFKITNELEHINHIETSPGARTSLLLSAQEELLLAVPARSGNSAELLIYTFN